MKLHTCFIDSDIHIENFSTYKDLYRRQWHSAMGAGGAGCSGRKMRVDAKLPDSMPLLLVHSGVSPGRQDAASPAAAAATSGPPAMRRSLPCSLQYVQQSVRSSTICLTSESKHSMFSFIYKCFLNTNFLPEIGNNKASNLDCFFGLQKSGTKSW